jgi:hypothetical protein
MLDRPDRVHYYPSFEMIRWVAGHFGQVFGGEDGSAGHVHSDMVELAVGLFVETCRRPEP